MVMVNVRSIAEMGAYVTLSEYNDIEGMILLSEVRARRTVSSCHALTECLRRIASAPHRPACTHAGRLACAVCIVYPCSTTLYVHLV